MTLSVVELLQDITGTPDQTNNNPGLEEQNQICNFGTNKHNKINILLLEYLLFKPYWKSTKAASEKMIIFKT